MEEALDLSFDRLLMMMMMLDYAVLYIYIYIVYTLSNADNTELT